MNGKIKSALLGIAIMLSVNFAFGQELLTSAASPFHQEKARVVSTYPVEMRAMELHSGVSGSNRSIYNNTNNRAGEPIWRPTKYKFYDGEIHLSNIEVTYNVDGSLSSKKGIELNGDLYYTLICNNTFTQEGWDFMDTLTYFQQYEGQTIPWIRYYYNYHYYDCLPEGCFFMEEYNQVWDISANEWKFTKRFYERYRDTILFEEEELIDEIFQNGKWVVTHAYMYPMTCCNEDGFETGFINKGYDLNLGEYFDRTNVKYVDWNPEGSKKESRSYNVQNDGTLTLRGKTTDASWTEWHGSGGIEHIIGLNYEHRTISKLRNKIHFDKGWNYDEATEEFTPGYHQIKTWYIDGTETNIDSTFLYHNGEPYLFNTLMHQYDNHGNYINYYSTVYTIPDNQGNQKIEESSQYKYVHEYHELYDEVSDMTCWIISYGNNKWDSMLWCRQEFYDWVDVTVPVSIAESESAAAVLSISPNPASGAITISAASEIEQLQIFDITGRLVHSHTPTSKEAIFDTGILAKGVYLVRALLKDGGAQTGKVVVQ